MAQQLPSSKLITGTVNDIKLDLPAFLTVLLNISILKRKSALSKEYSAIPKKVLASEMLASVKLFGVDSVRVVIFTPYPFDGV